jgi:hypothetical protein
MSSLEDLARASGTLLALGFPPGTDMGLDGYAFTTGPRFLGIKLIPPGWHLLHTSAPGSGVRSSLWLEVPVGGCAHVARWAAAEAAFALVLSTHGAHPGARGEGDEEAHRAAAAGAALALDERLGPYPLHLAPAWRTLTSRLSAPLLARLQPQGSCGAGGVGSGSGGSGGGGSSSAAPALAAAPPPPPRASPPAAAASAGSGEGAAPPPQQPPAPAPPPPLPLQGSPLVAPSAAQLLPRFLRLRGVGAGSLPSDRTAHAMDSSASLGSACAAAGGWPGLLGELQAAFAWCLVGQSFAALEHWKALADCVLRAEGALLAAAAPAAPAAGCAGSQAAQEAREGWAEALGSVLPAQLRALAGEEGLGVGEGVLRRGVVALARTGAQVEAVRGGCRAVRAAIGAALRAAVQCGVVEEAGFGELAQRLAAGGQAECGEAGAAPAEEAAAAAAAQASAAAGFATLAELLQHLELEGEGELPAVVFED